MARSGATFFDLESYETLSNNVKDHVFSAEVHKANILLLGPIGAGKSSFINSIFSLSKGRLANKAPIGKADTSFTKKYVHYTDNSMLKNFRLFDCMGIEVGENSGFHVDNLVCMLNGNVSEGYEFNPSSPINDKDPCYRCFPEEKDKIHCVVFCINACQLMTGIQAKIKSKIVELQDKIRELEVPMILIITNIDKEVQEDLSKTFRSVKIQELVDKANETFKIQRTNIHPVQNYENEHFLDRKINTLLLIALRQMLDCAEDYVDHVKEST